MHNFVKNTYILPLAPGDNALVDDAYLPASTAFIEAGKYRECTFMVYLGAVADDVVFTVRQDTSATITAGIKDLTGATFTIANATDDDKVLLIEFEVAKLDAANGYNYVTLQSTAVAGVDNAAVVFFGHEPRDVPVTQPAGVTASVLVAG